jgi:hypothetical protein
MTRDINFFYSLETTTDELPLEFADCVQVQNISGRTLVVIDNIFSTPLSTFLAHSDNTKIQSLISKKLLKVRSFTTSSSAAPVGNAEEPKKKRRKKDPSISSPQPLEGAVADLAAVINGENTTVAAEQENVEQLVEADSTVDVESSPKLQGEGSPETDSQSV